MKRDVLTYVIAAGGTGGHMYPADSLSAELQRRGHRVVLISDTRGLKFPDLFEGIERHIIESGTFAKRGLIGRIKTLFSLIKGSLKATWLLLKISPAGVIGFGGYPVLPAMAAARFLSIPYCLHEQNAVLGRANRAMAKGAKVIASSFTRTAKIKARFIKKTVVTGNPVRREIAELGTKPYPATPNDYVIRLLIFGGSQGAKVFSDVIPGALSLLPKAIRQRLQVTQQCREEDVARVKATYKDSGIAAEVFSYIRDIPERLMWSHLVISRAGATSLFEFAAAGRPAILIPLPGAMDDHQTANAKNMAASGAAWIMPEKTFTASELAKLMQKLCRDPKVLRDAGAAALKLGRPEAAEELADLVEDMVLPKKQRTKVRQARASEQAGVDNARRVMA